MDGIKKLSENRIGKGICTTIESPLFSVLLGVLALAFYALNLPLVTLCVFAVVATVILLLGEDTRGLIPLLLLLFVSLRNKDNVGAYTSKNAITMYAIIAPFFLFSLVYRLAVRRVEWQEKSGLLGVSLLCVAVLVGGVFTKYYSLDNFINAAAIALTLFGIYAFFAFTLKSREDNLIYIARVCAVAICVIALEVLEFYLRHYEKGMPLDAAWKYNLRLGWTRSNMVGEMLAFLLPSVFYLIYKEKFGFFYWLILPVAILAIYFTFSRNALLWCGVSTVVCVVVNCCSGRNKVVNLCVTTLLLVAVIVGVLFLQKAGKLDKLIEFFKEVGFDSRGRFKLWKDHWNLFLQSPLHGVGYKTYEAINGDWAAKAHNTLIQMLGSSGLIGLSLYAVHRVQTVRTIVKKPRADRLFMGGCILVGLLISLLSPLFFQVYFRVYYVVILIAIEKSHNREKQ